MRDLFEGVSNVNAESEAGFRAAANDAVEKYKQKHGMPEQGRPVRLRVADMYVRVQNPIHDYIVVLETQP